MTDAFANLSNKSNIAENNQKYGQWWCKHLHAKVLTIVRNYDSPGSGINLKLVRVKLYNRLTYRMEEVYLADLLLNITRDLTWPFPPKEPDDKNQVHLWGPYFISSVIYSFLSDAYTNRSSALDTTTNEPPGCRA